ncbi:MAG TPA: formylmethanofuran dehydrogenase subunit E family protein [Pyrinomonadaceae bacterium]|jgi:formylmethanofuran dehydrogenase subunit E|nr:formylmethanofuran dehydrogenase subunit E family protein [Pyrinomonadaceae bacterium]
MLPPLDELLRECEALHGHICPGQVLGARMALVGCRLIGVDDPRGGDRKKLIVWVEIDRCMTDALSAVTGVRLGRRSLKYFDYGKVAATFLNTETGRAVRLAALDSSRALADSRYASIQSKKERQMAAYREAAEAELFKIETVKVVLRETDTPGRPRTRLTCDKCLEGVNDGREVRGEGGEFLCLPCVNGAYYETDAIL